MKVLIVGAGEQGYVLTWNLVRHPGVSEIVLADWDEDRVREVVTRVGQGKTRAAKVDARDVDTGSGARREGRSSSSMLSSPSGTSL